MFLFSLLLGDKVLLWVKLFRSIFFLLGNTSIQPFVRVPVCLIGLQFLSASRSILVSVSRTWVSRVHFVHQTKGASPWWLYVSVEQVSRQQVYKWMEEVSSAQVSVDDIEQSDKSLVEHIEKSYKLWWMTKNNGASLLCHMHRIQVSVLNLNSEGTSLDRDI